MAILKINHSKEDSRKLMQYLEKNDRAAVKECINCTDNWANDFNMVKEANSNTAGRQVTHIVQSFENEEENANYTKQIINRIGRELVSKYAEQGYQAVVITHTDTENLHNHIVLNTVNEIDGKKIRIGKKELAELKEINDKLCMEYGLAVCQKGMVQRAYDEQYIDKNKKYYWKDDLRERLDRVFARTDIRGSNSFLSALAEEGISIAKSSATDKTKTITYSMIPKDSSMPKKARIIEYLDDNGNTVSQRNKLGNYSSSDVVNLIYSNKKLYAEQQQQQEQNRAEEYRAFLEKQRANQKAPEKKEEKQQTNTQDWGIGM